MSAFDPKRTLQEPMRTLIFATLALIEATAALAQDAPSGVGYRTVSAALESLRSMPGIDITTTKPDGWTIASDSKNNVQWSFTPSQHYAYPAVVKRAVKQRPDGNIYIEMTALCEADKASCDKLIEEFKALNERIGQNVRRKLKQGG
jgi:hypothetical protein